VSQGEYKPGPKFSSHHFITSVCLQSLVPTLRHITDPTWRFLFPYKTGYMNVGMKVGRVAHEIAVHH